MDHLDAILLFVSFIYYYFLLSPFKEKVKERNSFKLLINRRVLIIHLAISILLMLLGFGEAIRAGKISSVTFSLSPFLLIVTLLFLNHIYQLKYKKLFIILIKGDGFEGANKTQIIFSQIILAFPVLISLILIIA